jgi:hypothetical protein
VKGRYSRVNDTTGRNFVISKRFGASFVPNFKVRDKNITVPILYFFAALPCRHAGRENRRDIPPLQG